MWIDLIAKFAEDLESGWRKFDRDVNSFADVAAEQLARHAVSENFDYDDFINWLARRTVENPFERERFDFAEPSISVYSPPDSSFVVQVLFWTDFFRTGIHDHNVAGANLHLVGKSLHTVHRFTPDRTAAEGLRTGGLETIYADVVSKGHIYKITTGTSFIHEVFHLSYPTLTLIVRTNLPMDFLSTTYYPPYLRYDARDYNPLFEKQWEMEQLLRRVDPALAERYAENYLEHAEPYAQVTYLLRKCATADSLEEVEPILRRLATKLPWIAELEECINFRLAARMAAGGEVRDPDHRLLLGLLQTYGFGEKFFAAATKFFPGKPLAPLLDQWLKGIALRHPISPGILYRAASALAKAKQKDATPRDVAEILNRIDETHPKSALDQEVFRIWSVPNLAQLAGGAGAP